MAKKKNTAGHRKKRKDRKLRGQESHGSAENSESASHGGDKGDFEHEVIVIEAGQFTQHAIAEAAAARSNDHEGDTLIAADFDSGESLGSPEQFTSDQSFTSTPPRRFHPPRVARAVISSFNPYMSPKYNNSVQKSQKKEPQINDTDKKRAYPKMDSAFATDTFFQLPRMVRTYNGMSPNTKNFVGRPNNLNPQFQNIVASPNFYGKPTAKDQFNKFKPVSDKFDPLHPLGLMEDVSPMSLKFKSFSNNEKQKFMEENNIMNRGLIGYAADNTEENEKAGRQLDNIFDNFVIPLIDMDLANSRRKLFDSDRRFLNISSSPSLRGRSISTIAQVKAIMTDASNRSPFGWRMDTPDASNGDSSQVDSVEDDRSLEDMYDLQRRSRKQSWVGSCTTKNQTHDAAELLQTLTIVETQNTAEDRTSEAGEEQ